MPETVVNIHAAKTHLSQLVARAEKGKRITIARAGKPVAQLVPTPRRGRLKLPPDDPLLNLDKFAVDCPGGTLTNEEIDRILYGGSSANTRITATPSQTAPASWLCTN